MQVEDGKKRKTKVLISTIGAVFKRFSTAKTSIDTLVSNKTTALYYPPHMRASPSGKASASQADTRGFESRCPLQPEAQARHHYGAVLFSIKRRDSNPSRRRRRQAPEAGADLRSKYADVPLPAPWSKEDFGNGRFSLLCPRTSSGLGMPLKPVRICEANNADVPLLAPIPKC